jgi:pimeloyl-ACP methyl ester carboxylesterase
MNRLIPTTHGSIAIEETDGPGPVVLFIHGNSSCKEVFREQLSEFGNDYHCIAMDLPGHGHSDDAKDPKLTYNMTGYAQAAIEVLSGFPRPCFIVGWSLGGHIGIEMLAHTDQIRGLVITGTPPIGTGANMASAFLPHPHMQLTGQEVFSEAEAEDYAHTTCGEGRYEAFLGDAVRRTDGRARRMMMEAAQRGDGINQGRMVETSRVPLAVFNGRDENLVNNEFVKGIAYANLWRDEVFLLDHAGHAPFWDQPEAFNSLLREFLNEA